MPDPIVEKPEDKTLTQAQVDVIVQERLSRERAKYAGYEDLVKFKADHEKSLDAAKQKELESAKEYEKLKEGWTKKEQDFSGVIAKKDAEISDMKISSSLMTEIVKQNAYAEETMAMLKSQVVFDKENNIRIKGRDANGLEVMDSVEEGLKKFLMARPHLVKATKPGGGGTPPGTPPGGGGVGGDNLNALNSEFVQAQQRGDTKRVNELTVKMRALIGAQRTQL